MIRSANIRKTLPALKRYMKDHGYTGLFYPGECACAINDLAPCGEDHTACRLGYVVEASEHSEYEFYVQGKKEAK